MITLMKLFNQLTIASSVIIARFLESIDLVPQIKWPNDVLVNNKKIAGILVESLFQENNPTCAIIGIGLNVNQEEISNELQNSATSLLIENSKPIQREPLLAFILNVYLIKKKKIS